MNVFIKYRTNKTPHHQLAQNIAQPTFIQISNVNNTHKYVVARKKEKLFPFTLPILPDFSMSDTLCPYRATVWIQPAQDLTAIARRHALH